MKRYIILFCAILLFNINVVKADNTYKCQYFDDEGISKGAWNATYQFRYVVNLDDKTITFEDIPKDELIKDDWLPHKINVFIDPVINSDYSEKYYINKFEKLGKNTCQEIVNICRLKGSNNYFGILLNSALQSEFPNDVYIGGDSMPTYATHGLSEPNYKFFTSYESCLLDDKYKYGCDKVTIDKCYPFAFDDGEYSGKGNPGVVSYKCDRYTNDEKTGLKDDVEAKSNAYKDCEKKNSSGCSLEKLATEYNQAVEKLKSYCNNVIQNQNYGDACMTSCLGMINDLKSLEIEKTTETNECYLTDEIISFVYNVLKYAKYIAPVLAIILSILDFIKAIAASSEDEMKKAQGKFIKRLIVAALLFLVPLIINFLLQTFGVYNAKCDIGDLFS